MVSNQSTGHGPHVDSWSAVATALDQIGGHRPGVFAHPMDFRACTRCGQINVVRDSLLVCALCGDDLAEDWNIDQRYRAREPG